MLSRLHKLTLAVLLLPLVLAVVSLFLPARYRVERSRTMEADAEEAFRLLNTLRTWPEWTAWSTERFPDLKMTYAGPDSGVGSTATWSGQRCGVCTRKIIRSEPNRVVAFAIHFQPDRFMATSEITLQPSVQSVTVTWTQEAELGWSPVARFFGLLMDQLVGPDLEQNLQNLQGRLELWEEEDALP
jgi:hypothetical protein